MAFITSLICSRSPNPHSLFRQYAAALYADPGNGQSRRNGAFGAAAAAQMGFERGKRVPQMLCEEAEAAGKAEEEIRVSCCRDIP